MADETVCLNWRTSWPHAVRDIFAVRSTDEMSEVTCASCLHAMGSQKQDPPAVAEPLLASDASRRFMALHDQTGTPVHELAADAIHLAEDRGVEAAIRALGAFVSDIGTVRVDVTVDKRDLMRRIEKELGR